VLSAEEELQILPAAILARSGLLSLLLPAKHRGTSSQQPCHL